MVEISEDACELLLLKLQQALEGRPELRRRPIPPGLKLCMEKSKGHLSLGFPSQGDKVVSYQGKSVLIIAAKDLDELSDVCLRVQRSGSGTSLSIEPRQESAPAASFS